MAKKKTVGPDTAPTPAAPARRRPVKPAAEGAATPAANTAAAPKKRKTAAAAVRPDPGRAEPGATPAAEPDPAMPPSLGPTAGNSVPTHDDISREAYRRYVERGGRHGSDFDDWVEAERSLRDRK